MRHRHGYRKLNRTSAHRKALLKNLSIALIKYGRIETTLAKAKEMKPIADKLITLGKKGDLHARRQAQSFLQNPEAVKKLFDTLAPKYEKRQGGYTRVLKAGFRFGDSAPVGIIEFVDRDVEAKGKKDLERVAAEQAAMSEEEFAA